MNTGIIFDIKRYAIHDGPGIRTTIFFKGCPLKCWWCHNPESIVLNPELAFWENRCTECDKCIDICPNNAITKTEKYISIDRAKCRVSGNCAQVCLPGALEIIGKEISVENVMKEIEKDIPFYDESGGGATFSGGEPLMQLYFLNSLLENCKEKDIHTTVDTSGHAPFEAFDKIRDKVDFFLYDLKIMDDRKHKKYTGVTNELILNNLRLLNKKGSKINIRIPIIPGINDSQDNINKITQFILSLKNIREINLLPYHHGGSAKYKRLNKQDMIAGISPPLDKRLEKTKLKLEKLGLNVKIGG